MFGVGVGGSYSIGDPWSSEEGRGPSRRCGLHPVSVTIYIYIYIYIDRESGVEGESVYSRVYLGGRRIKKKKKKINRRNCDEL